MASKIEIEDNSIDELIEALSFALEKAELIQQPLLSLIIRMALLELANTVTGQISSANERNPIT